MHIVAYYFTHTTSLVELQEGLQKQYGAAQSKIWELGIQDCKPALCIDMFSHVHAHVLKQQMK